jgi:hypothetical protein
MSSAATALTMRMGCRRFTRLTNGFSKKLVNHVAAVSLYLAHYNLCRAHDALKRLLPLLSASLIGRGRLAIFLTRRWQSSRLHCTDRDGAGSAAAVPGNRGR